MSGDIPGASARREPCLHTAQVRHRRARRRRSHERSRHHATTRFLARRAQLPRARAPPADRRRMGRIDRIEARRVDRPVDRTRDRLAGRCHRRGRQSRSCGGAARLRRWPLDTPGTRRPRASHQQARRSDRGACRRTGRAGGDRQWQAEAYGRACRHPRCDPPVPLHGRLGDQGRRHAQRPVGSADRGLPRLYAARADRCRGADRAVEFPAADGRAEGRAGAGGGLHADPETRRTDQPDRAPARRTGARGGHSEWRGQYPHRPWRNGRRRIGAPSGRRQDRLHRIDQCRQDHHPHRRRHAEARDA